MQHFKIQSIYSVSYTHLGVGQAVGGMVGGAAIATKAVAAPATGGASAATVSYTHL